MNSVKILLVDSSLVVRKPLKQLLNNIPNLFVVGECLDEDEVAGFLNTNNVDVILMDVTAEFKNDFRAIRKIKQLYSTIKIVGFSFTDHLYYVNKMISCGADGFVSKFDANQDLISSELKRVVDFSD